MPTMQEWTVWMDLEWCFSRVSNGTYAISGVLLSQALIGPVGNLGIVLGFAVAESIGIGLYPVRYRWLALWLRRRLVSAPELCRWHQRSGIELLGDEVVAPLRRRLAPCGAKPTG